MTNSHSMHKFMFQKENLKHSYYDLDKIDYKKIKLAQKLQFSNSKSQGRFTPVKNNKFLIRSCSTTPRLQSSQSTRKLRRTIQW